MALDGTASPRMRGARLTPDHGISANITTRSGFDAGGRKFATLELGGAGYDTASTSAQAGGTAGKLGWVGAVSGVKSNRFLDTPSLDNLHNGGNAERAFARLDWQATEKNIFRFNDAIIRSLVVRAKEAVTEASPMMKPVEEKRVRRDEKPRSTESA